MYIKNVKILFATLSLMITILACGLPAANDATEIPASEVPATEASATDVPATEISTPESSPADQTASIQHQTIPIGLPDKQSGQAGDFDSSVVLENKTVVGGDRFTYGRFERPFNANTMDVYFSEIDIVDTGVFQDDIWIYGSILIKELNANSSSTVKYAIELDTDLDGKGDWLIIAAKPASTDWVVSGVQVYEDANGDVGAELPMLSDKSVVGGDGFESLVFDQGQGNDADSAWVRISPNNPNMIEIVVKQSVVGSPNKYLINMWAGTSLIDPALFDLNDHFTHDQAGAADNGLQYYYPIKEVSELDSSCRMAVGFQPTGTEPGLCESFIPKNEHSAPPPPPGVTGCQATQSEISACNQDVYCNWSSSACSCVCNIPR